jgi:arginine/lysine/ornithine decarboxylase
LDAVAEYLSLDRYGFTPPGHRQGHGVDRRVIEVLGGRVFECDILASAGMDDRQSSNGYLQEAQDLLADAVGADQTFFSTCGSSLSVKACMLAVSEGHGDLLVGRDAHKSVIAGLVLSGLTPRWVSPRWDADLHLAHPPSPEAVAEAWRSHPDAAGLLITSPTPYGTCAEIERIADICHAHGKPLIVDEAWGAHLPFHPDLPTWAMSAKADLCVTSVHKMGMGFEQGSTYHLQGKLIDPARLSQCADLLATTSANVLIYAAMDGWRRQMAIDGEAILTRALEVVHTARSRLDRLGGIRVLREELIGPEASHDLDPFHVLMDVSDLGISGYQAADWLREYHRIDAGVSDHRRIELTLSQADDDATVDRAVAAFEDLIANASSLPRPKPVRVPDPSSLELEVGELPRDAFFGPIEDVRLHKAIGRIAAEQITPYPPGIPVVLPGEIINEAVVDYLRSGVAAGMVIPDAADPSMKHIRVSTSQ